MKRNNGNTRAISRIKRVLLEHGEVDTVTLYDNVKEQKNSEGKVYQNTSTLNEMANLLRRTEQFERCGHTARNRLGGGSYQVQVWRLRRGNNETKL